jgi:two-component sensor histidine kinase
LDFGDYANSLVADIFETYERPGITYSIVADPVKLNVDQAIPCGLILNELVTNGVKHAYPDGIGGELRVTVSKTLEEVRITVSDDGVGVEDSVLLGERNSLGLTIVMILAKQLGGKFTVVQQPGATFTITFPRKSTLITTAAAINVAPQPPALG